MAEEEPGGKPHEGAAVASEGAESRFFRLSLANGTTLIPA